MKTKQATGPLVYCCHSSNMVKSLVYSGYRNLPRFEAYVCHSHKSVLDHQMDQMVLLSYWKRRQFRG